MMISKLKQELGATAGLDDDFEQEELEYMYMRRLEADSDVARSSTSGQVDVPHPQGSNDVEMSEDE